MKFLSTTFVCAVLLAAPVLACDEEEMAQDMHAGHDMGSMEMASNSDVPLASEWTDINMKMHEGMAIDFTGDPDKDFLLGMIPHHQGAVEMAELVLKHGKDERVLELARGIIEAQEREIAMMNSWVAE